jgi:hypothetical protein
LEDGHHRQADCRLNAISADEIADQERSFLGLDADYGVWDWNVGEIGALEGESGA